MSHYLDPSQPDAHYHRPTTVRSTSIPKPPAMTPTHRSDHMTDKLRAVLEQIAALEPHPAVPNDRRAQALARAALAAAPQPAMREETGMEHIARDMREGRFPERSPRQKVPADDVLQCRPCRHEWFERECVHCGIAVADFRAAAPQPAPVIVGVDMASRPDFTAEYVVMRPAPADREALVEVIAEARGHFTPREMAWAGNGYHDEERAIADALLARGLRLPDDKPRP